MVLACAKHPDKFTHSIFLILCLSIYQAVLTSDVRTRRSYFIYIQGVFHVHPGYFLADSRIWVLLSSTLAFICNINECQAANTAGNIPHPIMLVSRMQLVACVRRLLTELEVSCPPRGEDSMHTVPYEVRQDQGTDN